MTPARLILFLFLVAVNTTATPIQNTTVVLKVSTLNSFYRGNPNNIAGQAIWTFVATNTSYYTQNQIKLRLCCSNCNYLNSIRFSLDDYTQFAHFNFSEYNTTSLCLNSYTELIGDIPLSINTNNTIIYAIDDRGCTHTRLHTGAIEEIDTLVEITNTPPSEIQHIPPPPPNPHPCPTGTYSNSSSSNGSTNCTGCSPGYYSMGSNNTICNSCSPGSYSNSSNAITCISCPSGTYQPNYGSTLCIDCPDGSYSNQTNSTSCTSCSPGTYSSSPGYSGCSSCVAATGNSTYCEPLPFQNNQFETLFVNDTHTTIGFKDGLTHDFELFYNFGFRGLVFNESNFTVSFVDILSSTTFLGIRSYATNDVTGDITYSNTTQIIIPSQPDITKFTALTTDGNYQGIVIELDNRPSLDYLDYNFIFYRDNVTTSVNHVQWASVYHNSYLNGSINSTNFTFRVQATSIFNPLLLSQWSNCANRSSVAYWNDSPAPQVWLEFENDSLYDWFNDKISAYTNNATLTFKHTQDPDEYRMNGHLYRIGNGTDIVHTVNGALSNWTWSIVLWTYIESNSTSYTLINTTYGNLRVENGSINWHVAFFSNKTVTIIDNSPSALNRWYQIGIEYDDHFGHMAVYINGQYYEVHTDLPPYLSQIVSPHFNATIVNGPIDNLVIFTDQTIGPLYVAALFEFYGFPYLCTFNVSVSNSVDYIYIT